MHGAPRRYNRATAVADPVPLSNHPTLGRTLAGRASPSLVVAVALLPLPMGACRVEEAHDLPGDLAWTSPHFIFHARAQDSLACPDALTNLEQHFALLEGMFGFVWPAGRSIHYYKFVDHPDFHANSPCPQGSGACADQSDVYSDEVFEQHELIHSYLWPFGTPPPLVTEGTAVALACNRPISDTPSLSLAEGIRIQDALSDLRIYDTGGRLVRYLLDRYGPQAFLRFYVQLGKHADFDDLDALMQEVFGAGADQIWAAALDAPTSCPPPFACSRDALPLDGTPVALSASCGLTTGNRTFALTTQTQVAIAAPSSTSVSSCDPIHFVAIRATSARRDTSHVGVVDLPAGHYYLEYPTDGPTTELAIREATQPWAGLDCSSLQPLVVAAGQYPDLSVSVPGGVSEWLVRLRFVEPHLLRLLPADLAGHKPFTVTVCRDCDSASPLCVAYDARSSVRDVLWQGDYYLRFQTSNSSDAARLDIVRR